MSENLKSQLEAWNLGMIFPLLESNGMDNIELLIDLLKPENSAELLSIVPDMVSRVKLRKNINDLIKSSKDATSQGDSDIPKVIPIENLSGLTDEEVAQSLRIQTMCTISDNNHLNMEVSDCLEADDENPPKTVSLPQDDSEVNSLESKKILIQNVEFDLLEVLSNNAIGRSLLLISKYTSDFSPIAQSYLCEIIVLHFLNQNMRNLQNADILLIAKEITRLFHHEIIESYYVAPVKKKDSKNNKSGISKGKLVDKYRNRLTFIRESEKLLECFIEDPDTAGPVINIELQTAEESRTWLIHNREPEEEVRKHWDTSYPARLEDCKKNVYKNVKDIFMKWPILETSTGYTLTERDFIRKYPGTENKLINNWSTYYGKFHNLFKDNLTPADKLLQDLESSKTIPMDSKVVLQMWLLSTMIAPKSNKIITKMNDKVMYWKPTCIDTRNGIIVHCKVPGDMEELFKQKERDMAARKLTVQPFLFVVGPEITSIEKIYVRIDSVTYEVPSVLKGIDVLFKNFITYNSCYPLECEQLWYLIQWAIYEIETASDIKIPYICNAINRLNRNIKKAKRKIK